MFGRKKAEEDPLTTLARCIIILDDVRAYRRKDTKYAEETWSNLKRTRFKDLYDVWPKVHPHVDKIIEMPSHVPGVPRMIRALSWLKVANRILLIFLVIFIAVQIVPVWSDMLGPDPFGGNGFLYTLIFVMLAVLSLNAATVIDYSIRKKIVAYEKETEREFATAREKLREGVNKLMRALAKEAERSTQDSSYWGLVLYFADYDNIKVIKQWRPRSVGVFKKPYSLYQVVPKLS